jgi:hypothetical protein
MPWRKAPGTTFAAPRVAKLDGDGQTVTTRRLRVKVATGQRA